MEMLQITLILCTLGISAYSLYKVRKIHLATFRLESDSETIRFESENFFRQYQAFSALISLIKPRKPLPTLRGWAASPDFLLYIAQHTLNTHPKLIVECSSGSSTLVLARCCEINGSGHLYSLEHDAFYADQTRSLLREHGLTDWATIIHAPLSSQEGDDAQYWYSTEEIEKLTENSVDLLVIDGPPNSKGTMARYPALPKLYSKLSSHCAVFLDDSARCDEQQTVARWLNEFPRYTSTQLNAEKGCVMLQRKAEHN